MTTGITAMGNTAEDEVIALTGAQKSTIRKSGDVVFVEDYVPYYVEIKEADGGTANQVRADKYIPLVVRSNGRWFVFSPVDVLRLVKDKSRGQHSENPLENATVGGFKKPSPELLKHEVPANQLKQAIFDAIKLGEQYPKLEEAVRRVPSEIEELSARQHLCINRVMTEYGLPTTPLNTRKSKTDDVFVID